MDVKSKIDRRIVGGFGVLFFFMLCVASWALEWRGLSATINSETRYQVQWSDDPHRPYTSDENSDQDFYELLGVEADLPWQKLHFSFYGRYAKDLDGTLKGSIYQDILETSPERQRLDVYYAYLERQNLWRGLDVRLGRMYIYGADIVHMDGLSLSWDRLFKSRLDVQLFGGLIVQMYCNLSQDLVGGFNVNVHPLSDLDLSVKTVFYRETSYRFDLSWRPFEGVKLVGYWELINNHSRDFNVDLLVRLPKVGTYVGVNVYRRFWIARDTEDDFLYDYTFSIGDGLKTDIRRFYLSKEAAYWEITLSVTQPVPKVAGLVVYGKLNWRWLAHDKYEDFFNTDFAKYSVGFSWEEPIGLKGFYIDSGFSHWRENRDWSPIYESESHSYYLDLRQDLFNRLQLRAGFYYKDEDINSMIEREGSKVLYGAVKYFFDREAHHKWVEVRYEYNEADYFEQYGFSSLNLLMVNLGIKL
ncbi:MAG: hypothetical protein DSZ24_07240 [Thermodesulfatator sp.]|nr:MAG: hypothetical protein DSZ24_07240 [Thermodesulfatator sp.]